MSDEAPYAPPAAPVGPAPEGELSETLRDSLRRTRLWLALAATAATLFAILIFAGQAVAVLLDPDKGPPGGEAGYVTGMVIGVLLSAALFSIPAIKLWQLFRATGRCRVDLRLETLEDLMDQHRRTWRALSILLAVVAGVFFFTGAAMIFAALVNTFG